MRKPTLAEAKGSAVSHDQTVGHTPGVILPALTAYPKHAREPPNVRQVAVLIGPGEAMRNWSFCVPVQAGRAEDRVDVGAGLRGLGDGQLPGNGCGGSSPTSPPMA